MLFRAYAVEGIYCDLRRFSDFVRSVDLLVEAVDLRPGDRAGLQRAIAAMEKVIDEQAQRPPRHAATRAIARDLKETRRAALVQRFERLRGRSSAMTLDKPRARGRLEPSAAL